MFESSLYGSVGRLFCRDLLSLVSAFDSSSEFLFKSGCSFCEVKGEGLEMLQDVFLRLSRSSKASVMLTIRLNSGDSFLSRNLVIIT